MISGSEYFQNPFNFYESQGVRKYELNQLRLILHPNKTSKRHEGGTD